MIGQLERVLRYERETVTYLHSPSYSVMSETQKQIALCAFNPGESISGPDM